MSPAGASPSAVVVTDDDHAQASAQIRRSTRGVIPLALGVQVVAQFVATVFVTRVWSLDGLALWAALVGATLVVLAPVVLVISRVATDKSVRQLAESLAREREMTADARRRDFETRLGNALEMAASETEVLSVTERALRSVTGEQRVELLLADNSHAHLEQALVSGADPVGPGCRVESPERCVAARRGQTQVFADSEALDACPQLQGRSYGGCSAVCVPVSIMGRTTGVVHWAEPAPAALPPTAVGQLEILANQVGGRIGMLRVVSESQLQATTDHLTGLLNRRAFENQVRALRETHDEVTVVLTDLDHFKQLNDTHGHDAGDRALRTFVNVLRTVMRPTDVACRYGGEEFVLALPGCSTNDAVAVCERLREDLAITALDGSVPAFTASFGIAALAAGQPLDEAIRDADSALYQAKRSGRNRSVVYRSIERTRGHATGETVHLPTAGVDPTGALLI